MNRQMRRAADRAKPIEYQRVPLPRYLDEFTVFSDIERVLEKIEHGEIEHVNGKPVLLSSSGEWCEVVPALNGWISGWKLFDQKFNLNHDISPMVRICNCLNYGSPISQRQIEAAQETLRQERSLFRRIPRDEIASAARTKQIQLLMGGD